ncbi:MAG: imidazole glycerol phosphate synthase subunit HisF [Elusimicrobiota bacterium]
MLTKRIVACLDVKDGVVVKGLKFRGHEPMGDPVELALRYRGQGVDELVFYDIAASAEGRRVSREWVAKTAAALDIPFCVAGGIRSVAGAEELLNAGADKISVNSPALERPELITELAKRFGAQCVVVGVDSRLDEGEWRVFQYTGLVEKTVSAKRRMLDWLAEIQDRGAGEVVLNCMDADGTGAGYDIEQLSAARGVLKLPLVASGGAKTAAHFVRVFKEAGVDAALAAGAFHRGELEIGALKRELKSSGIEVRP